MTICAFTGHRLQNLPFKFDESDRRCIKLKNLLKKIILEKILKQNVNCFFTGMALGVDCFAAETVLELKRKYPYIKLIAIVPCADQTIKWRQCDVIRYNAILEKCSEVIVLQQHYTTGCMNRRNIYMTEHSDCVIAVWDGTKSGTGNTVKFALERGKPVTVLNPITLEISYLSTK